MLCPTPDGCVPVCPDCRNNATFPTGLGLSLPLLETEGGHENPIGNEPHYKELVQRRTKRRNLITTTGIFKTLLPLCSDLGRANHPFKLTQASCPQLQIDTSNLCQPAQSGVFTPCPSYPTSKVDSCLQGLNHGPTQQAQCHLTSRADRC